MKRARVLALAAAMVLSCANLSALCVIASPDPFIWYDLPDELRNGWNGFTASHTNGAEIKARYRTIPHEVYKSKNYADYLRNLESSADRSFLGTSVFFKEPVILRESTLIDFIGNRLIIQQRIAARPLIGEDVALIRQYRIYSIFDDFRLAEYSFFITEDYWDNDAEEILKSIWN